MLLVSLELMVDYTAEQLIINNTTFMYTNMYIYSIVNLEERYHTIIIQITF